MTFVWFCDLTSKMWFIFSLPLNSVTPTLLFDVCENKSEVDKYLDCKTKFVSRILFMLWIPVPYLIIMMCYYVVIQNFLFYKKNCIVKFWKCIKRLKRKALPLNEFKDLGLINKYLSIDTKPARFPNDNIARLK